MTGVYLRVSLQPVPWATSSRFRAQFPAQCVPPTAEPARRDRVCVNVVAAFTEQPTTPTPLPAQVSFVCLFMPGMRRSGASAMSFVSENSETETDCGQILHHSL